MMEKWTFSDARVARAMADFAPVGVRGDIELQAARKLGVKTYPTIVFFRQGEGEIDRKVGFRNAEFMIKWMKRVLRNESTIASLRKRLRRNING